MQLNNILYSAISNKASDIHLAVGLPPIFRINGKLVRCECAPLTQEDNIKYAKEILGDVFFKEFEDNYEFDCSYDYQKEVYFRVNVFKQRSNYGIVMRLIPSKVPTIEQLSLPEVFRSLCMRRRGLILVTGPTGSGKTTTLAAMINYMSQVRNEHIITLEDPIEYVYKNGTGIVNQRQLGTDTKSFAHAIRAALREDPDVILIGEMRDFETIAAAVTAAETGHLVLSTLHTVGAAKTIERIIDVFPGTQQAQIRTQLGSVLQAVISQQLIPNVTNTGRCLALEIMIANNAILNLITEGKASQIGNAMQTGTAEGMITMDQSLVNLYLDGRIDEKNLFKYCVNPKEVRQRLS